MVSERNHPQAETMSYEQAAALYQKLESQAALVRLAHASPRRPRLGWRTAFWLGGATAFAAVGAAVLILVVGLFGDHGHEVTAGRGNQSHHVAVPPGSYGDLLQLGPDSGINGNGIEIDPGFGHDPFGVGGKRVSLATVERIAHFAVLTPDSHLASSKNLSGIWFSPVGNGSGTTGEIILEYARTGVRISIRPANTVLLSDASGQFANMAKDVHATPGAMAINGAPALVQDGNRQNPGFAELVRDGVAATVMGPYPAVDLITVAQSLSLETRRNG